MPHTPACVSLVPRLPAPPGARLAGLSACKCLLCCDASVFQKTCKWHIHREREDEVKTNTGRGDEGEEVKHEEVKGTRCGLGPISHALSIWPHIWF